MQCSSLTQNFDFDCLILICIIDLVWVNIQNLKTKMYFRKCSTLYFFFFFVLVNIHYKLFIFIK